MAAGRGKGLWLPEAARGRPRPGQLLIGPPRGSFGKSPPTPVRVLKDVPSGLRVLKQLKYIYDIKLVVVKSNSTNSLFLFEHVNVGTVIKH